jgi:hypothetical protein
VRRRPHIAGTRAPRWRREVATGGDPVGNLTAALLEIKVRPGEVWDCAIGHDDGCPALRHGIRACDCEVVRLEARRMA